MEPIRFTGRVRYWKPERASGLAVVDVPEEAVTPLGGLRQQRVHGTIEGNTFTSSVMPAGGGRLAMSVSQAMLKGASRQVGEEASFEILRTGE